MAKVSMERFSTIMFFLMLLLGAAFCLQRLTQDMLAGKYFSSPEEFYHELVFIISYLLIILFILRYGYFLAIKRISWSAIKDDFLYLLNKKYFTKAQWMLNVLIFWLALVGFVYSLAISVMKGNI